MSKRWSKNETTYLKRYAAKRRVMDLADRFGVDADTVRAKLNDMDLAAADHQRPASEPDPGIESLEKGVKALYAKKYAQAEKHLVQAEAAARRARRGQPGATLSGDGQEPAGGGDEGALTPIWRRSTSATRATSRRRSRSAAVAGARARTSASPIWRRRSTR